MDVMTAIETRRSIRRYSACPVEEEKLNRVLEAGRLAPSARNLQELKFVVVRDPETRLRLKEAAGGQGCVAQAPVFLAVCGTNPGAVMSCGQPRYTVDASIALSFMILEAQAQGLGTCWLGHFDEAKIRQILGIPESVRVVAVTPLGYPDEAPAPRSRKSLTELACMEKYR